MFDLHLPQRRETGETIKSYPVVARKWLRIEANRPAIWEYGFSQQ
jgi:hypothetical protein